MRRGGGNRQQAARAADRQCGSTACKEDGALGTGPPPAPAPKARVMRWSQPDVSQPQHFQRYGFIFMVPCFYGDTWFLFTAKS